MSLPFLIIGTAVALVVGLVGSCITAHHTEHITWREVIRRLAHGYRRPEEGS